MGHSGVVLNNPGSQTSGPRSFPVRGEYDVDIVNHLLKNDGGETKGLMLLIL